MVRVLFTYGLLVGWLVFSPATAEAAPWEFHGEGTSVAIDGEKAGQLIGWEVDGKKLVEAKDPGSPLVLQDEKGGEWEFRPESFSAEKRGELSIKGHLTAAGHPQIAAVLNYRIKDEGRGITVEVEAPSVSDIGIRKFGWSLSLSLSPRKRVFFASDHGLPWDSRYFYQLTFNPASGKGADVSLLQPPDRNEWRFFGLDQLGPDGYRLWKSEGKDTAPLVMHEGRTPVPAVQIYDEEGGVTVDYPALTTEAPKSLRIDAAGGGRVEVLFYPDSVAAQPAGSGRTFGKQEIYLTAQSSEQAALKEQENLVSRYSATFSKPPDPEKVLQEPSWIVNAPEETGSPVYVVGGYPFARGALRDAKEVGVEAAGVPVPVQAETEAFWPDGSIKWVRLVFPVDAAKAVSDGPTPRVSLRNGKDLPLKIVTKNSLTVPKVELSATQTKAGGIQISNGALKVELGDGQDWLRHVEYQGNAVVDSSDPQRRAAAYANFALDPQEVSPFAVAALGGHPDPGVLKVDKIALEEAGPLRAVVRLEGETTNQEPARIVLRLEFFAGRPEIRVSHTIIFRFKDPRRTFLTGLGLDLPIPEGAKANRPVVQVAQITTTHREETADGKPDDDLKAPASWLTLVGSRTTLTAAIRNFRETAPKALTADFSTNRLKIELWPGSVGPMDVRRYSNYLHEAQLESPMQYPTAKDWVRTEYYTKDPFYGVSRTHEFLVSFGDQKSPVNGESIAADLQSPPLLYAGWDRYAGTGVLLPSSTESEWPKAWEAWTRLTTFFLYHRELHSWYGFWNFGDFRHRFRGGFGWTHPPEVLAALLKGSVPDEPKAMQAARRLDYVPPNDWNYDNGAYGWSNTEGLPGMFLAHEYLRHGNRVVYFASEAMARYGRDVITRQEGRWLGTGTRHGVQPWSDGNHEERQTSVTEYRLNYFLSGDGRSRDVLENLYKNVYTKGLIQSRAAHSARLGGLLFHWEVTGDPAEGEQLARYISFFLSDEGIYLEPKVRFPGPVAEGKPGSLNSGSMFFHTFGGMHALIEYQQITGDEKVKEALLHMADVLVKKPVIENGTLGNGDYSWPPIAFAAAHAADPTPYRKFLRRYIEKGGWRNAYQPVTKDTSKWTGPSAFMSSPVALTFFWANWAPYVTYSLGDTEVWTPQIATDFTHWENYRPPSRKAGWQSDYDRMAELKDYLGPWQPWMTGPVSSPIPIKSVSPSKPSKTTIDEP